MGRRRRRFFAFHSVACLPDERHREDDDDHDDDRGKVGIEKPNKNRPFQEHKKRKKKSLRELDAKQKKKKTIENIPSRGILLAYLLLCLH